MSTKLTAAESIRRMAVQYQHMIEAADVLEQLGKLDVAMAEAQAATAKAQSERDAALAEVKQAKSAVSAAKVQADAIITKANDQALATLQEAEQRAQAIADGATARANGVMTAAETEASKLQAGLAGKVAQLTSSKVQLEQDIAALNQAAEHKRAEAEDLEARIAKAQKQIAKLLG